jgi:hypothetical protein
MASMRSRLDLGNIELLVFSFKMNMMIVGFVQYEYSYS